MQMKIGDLRKVLDNLSIDEYEYFILDHGKGPWAEVYVSIDFNGKHFNVSVIERGTTVKVDTFVREEDACDKFLEFMQYNKKIKQYLMNNKTID